MTEMLAPMTFGPVTSDDILVWAKALHDPNPIHFDADAVRARNLGDAPIVQGTVGVAYVATMLQTARPALRIARLETRFIGLAFQGDRLEVSARVLAEDAGNMRCSFSVTAIGRGEVLSGEAEMRA